MHASISHFPGDPDDLQERYDAMLADIPPASFLLHLCLRAPDGLTVVDTCPSEQDFHAFHHGEAFRSVRAKHGLPDPDRIEDLPVHVAFAGGAAVTTGH